jgi:hypothetical protein
MSERRIFPGFPAITLLTLLAPAVATADTATPQAPTPDSIGPASAVLYLGKQEPSSARVYVDGVRISSSTQELSAGTHRVVAVAPGYYGECRLLLLASGSNRRIDIVLQPTALPTSTTMERFFVLADSATITVADVESMPEYTLRLALRAKLLRQEHNTYALDRMRHDLASLMQLGDARSAVTTFLWGASESGRFSQSLVTDALRNASQENDPMATFFLATAIRDGLREHGLSPSSQEFASYCANLTRARGQGWPEVANSWLRRDNCPW